MKLVCRSKIAVRYSRMHMNYILHNKLLLMKKIAHKHLQVTVKKKITLLQRVVLQRNTCIYQDS